MQNGSSNVDFDTLRCLECGATIPVSKAIAAAHEAHHRQLFEEAERQIAERAAGLEREVNERVEAVILQRISEVNDNARNCVAIEIADLKRQISEKNEQVEAAREMELALRAERRALEERTKAADLEIARKLDAERQAIEASISTRLEEEHRLRIADKDKALQDALRVNQELNRKLQQGSQQSQGEVLEEELETILKCAFPTDQIEPVPNGVNGADVIHKVISQSGIVCGTIVWEAKRTKK